MARVESSRVAVCCRAFQCVQVCCSVLQFRGGGLRFVDSRGSGCMCVHVCVYACVCVCVCVCVFVDVALLVVRSN